MWSKSYLGLADKVARYFIAISYVFFRRLSRTVFEPFESKPLRLNNVNLGAVGEIAITGNKEIYANTLFA